MWHKNWADIVTVLGQYEAKSMYDVLFALLTSTKNYPVSPLVLYYNVLTHLSFCININRTLSSFGPPIIIRPLLRTVWVTFPFSQVRIAQLTPLHFY